jgi:hypothetical protein
MMSQMRTYALKYWGYLRISLCKMCNRIHIIYSHLQIELNYGKAPNKWVNVSSTIHIKLISIM